MVEYNKVNVKLTDTRPKNLKPQFKRMFKTSFIMLDGKICLMNCYWLQDKEQS